MNNKKPLYSKPLYPVCDYIPKDIIKEMKRGSERLYYRCMIYKNISRENVQYIPDTLAF